MVHRRRTRVIEALENLIFWARHCAVNGKPRGGSISQALLHFGVWWSVFGDGVRVSGENVKCGGRWGEHSRRQSSMREP